MGAVLITKCSGIILDVFRLGGRRPPRGCTIKLSGTQTPTRQVDKRNNLFKWWILMKAKGRRGWEAHVDRNMAHSAWLQQQIYARRGEGFRLVLPSFDMTNVCFWYVPRSLRGLDTESKEYTTQLGQASFNIERVLTVRRVMGVVAQQRFERGGPVFFQFVAMDSGGRMRADVEYLLQAVVYWGEHWNRTVEPPNA